MQVLRTALADGPMARRQIRERMVVAGVLEEPVGQSLVHLLYHAAALGVICSGPRMGRDDSFVLLDDWVPRSSRGPSGGAALAELARRYFAAYGPAGAADFAAWSGLRQPMIRAAMAAIVPELVEFPGSIRGLWTLGAADVGGIARPDIRLLGHFDTYLLGYRRREHLGGAEAEAWIHDGGGGWIRPVICVDGWIAGGWRLERTAREIEITIMPFDRIGRGADAAIGREVAAISRFLDRPAHWLRGPLVGFGSAQS